MAKRVEFVLNRRNFRDQILKGEGTAALLAETLGDEAVLDTAPDGARVRARRYGSMSKEAQSGYLSRMLGGR